AIAKREESVVEASLERLPCVPAVPFEVDLVLGGLIGRANVLPAPVCRTASAPALEVVGGAANAYRPVRHRRPSDEPPAGKAHAPTVRQRLALVAPVQIEDGLVGEVLATC